jgi:cyclophilin family peptidyl-prolyl cis-trans isomerase
MSVSRRGLAKKSNRKGRRWLAVERLEDRSMLSVTLNNITGPDSGSVFDIPSGKDLYVPLIGTDTGKTITYSASSGNASVKAVVLTGNPTLQLTVQGKTAGNQSFSGTMTFQLFENIAPQTVQGIINEVNAGLYNGASFYRMETSSTFELIQGGIEMTSGKSDTTVLPDEFNETASFNSSGLLAMANAGPNTATSEFFVTAPNRPLADDPQFLNYGYTIFGQIITGQTIYSDILNAPTTSDNGIHYANSPITITAASIITDTQNGVVQISEPSNFTGTATITITGSGSDGTSAQKTFTVSAAPPTNTSVQPLILNPVSNLTTTTNTAVNVQFNTTLNAGITGDNFTFSVTGTSSFTGAPSNVSVQVSPGSTGGMATVKLTPSSGFTGTINLVAHVDDSTNSLHDALPFTLTVNAPVSVTSVTDPVNSSNDTNTSISGTGQAGFTISVVATDGTHSTTAKTTTVSSGGTWSISGINVSSLNDGTITYTATQTDTSNNTTTSSKTTIKDTVPPMVSISSVTNPINIGNVTNTTASGTGEVGATISVMASDGSHTTTAATTTVGSGGTWSISGINVSALNDGTITYTATATDSANNSASSTKTANKDTVDTVLGDFSLDGKLTNADLQAGLSALEDLTGYQSTHGLTDAELLTIGDVNHDGLVNSADIAALQKLLVGYPTPTPPSLIPGDFNQDGQVNGADIGAMMHALTNLNAYKAQYGLSNANLLAIGDINHDGSVTDADLQALLNLMKSGGGSESASGSSSLSAESQSSAIANPSTQENNTSSPEIATITNSTPSDDRAAPLASVVDPTRTVTSTVESVAPPQIDLVVENATDPVVTSVINTNSVVPAGTVSIPVPFGSKSDPVSLSASDSAPATILSVNETIAMANFPESEYEPLFVGAFESLGPINPTGAETGGASSHESIQVE